MSSLPVAVSTVAVMTTALFATWEKACAVDGPERVTGWSFGLGAPGLDELSEDELEAFPSQAIF